MYKCNECGEIFEEPWEMYDKATGSRDSGCPHCDADNYDETYICSKCGDYGADELGGICGECRQEIYHVLTNIKYDLVSGGMSEYDAVTVIQDWVEAS